MDQERKPLSFLKYFLVGMLPGAFVGWVNAGVNSIGGGSGWDQLLLSFLPPVLVGGLVGIFFYSLAYLKHLNVTANTLQDKHRAKIIFLVIMIVLIAVFFFLFS